MPGARSGVIASSGHGEFGQLASGGFELPVWRPGRQSLANPVSRLVLTVETEIRSRPAWRSPTTLRAPTRAAPAAPMSGQGCHDRCSNLARGGRVRRDLLRRFLSLAGVGDQVVDERGVDAGVAVVPARRPARDPRM